MVGRHIFEKNFYMYFAICVRSQMPAPGPLCIWYGQEDTALTVGLPSGVARIWSEEAGAQKLLGVFTRRLST